MISHSCDRFTLPNGLRVVVASDHTAPVVAVSVHYDVGARSEPEDRSGFAHLFEHLMFRGSESVPLMEYPRLIQGAGGRFNGVTTHDYTLYYSVVPAPSVELALFLEADRMRAPHLTEDNLRTQIDVVKEEILTMRHGQPYGGWPQTQMRPLMFQTFPNTHDGYGDFVSLESATLADCASFFETYYAPGNAVLTLAGDITAEQARDLVERHFGDIDARDVPALPSFVEPLPASEVRGEHTDPLAPLPAFSVGYHMPDPITRVDDYLTYMVLIDVLTEGSSARLTQRLMHGGQPLVAQLHGGPFSGGFHTRGTDPFSINAIAMPGMPVEFFLDALDRELERLAQTAPEPWEVTKSANRWRTAVHAQLQDHTERAKGLGLFALLHDDPLLLPQIPQRLDRVTPDAVCAAAKAVVSDTRTVLTVNPGGAA